MYTIRINVIRIFEQFEIQTEARFFLESRKTLEKFKFDSKVRIISIFLSMF